jgi:hypothetical protein
MLPSCPFAPKFFVILYLMIKTIILQINFTLIRILSLVFSFVGRDHYYQVNGKNLGLRYLISFIFKLSWEGKDLGFRS